MNRKYFLAVDLGATSGRTIVGRLADGRIHLEELTRFPNHIIEEDGHFYWDIHALYDEVIRGLKTAAERHLDICSIGIDTWGVDFVCVGEDGKILSNPRCYRDPVTFQAMDDYLENVHSRRKVYDATGIQLMNFNSLFQLYAMRREDNAALNHARKILFMPDALNWMLTGHAVCEYTIASTSQMLDPRAQEFDTALLNSVGLTRDYFGPMVMPGTIVGTLTEEVQRMTGLGPVPVVAVAGHDTGSAVAAVPALDERFAYLSSGTWSLMGVETNHPIITSESYDRNFTNEGGIEGTVRFLKNICGMWLLERCRQEWTDAPADYVTLFENAMKVEPFRCLINPDDPAFANPVSMVEAIQTYCRETGQPVPVGYAEQTRCILESLALRYRQVFGLLADMAPFAISRLHIIGGGSRNAYLNQFTANATGVEVVAGPAEGTAQGNIMVQAKATGEVKDIWQMRSIIADSLDLQHYQPQDRAVWDAAYDKYLHITNQ